MKTGGIPVLIPVLEQFLLHSDGLREEDIVLEVQVLHDIVVHFFEFMEGDTMRYTGIFRRIILIGKSSHPFDQFGRCIMFMLHHLLYRFTKRAYQSGLHNPLPPAMPYAGNGGEHLQYNR